MTEKKATKKSSRKSAPKAETEMKTEKKNYVEYISKYVYFPSDGGHTAADYLTDVLNDLSKDGWQIIRSEIIQNGFGYLIVAAKQPQLSFEEILQQAMPGMKIVHLDGKDASSFNEAALTRDSRAFLNEFMQNNKYVGERLLEKADETLAPMLKKYSGVQLRPIIDNMKVYLKDHLTNHDGPPCEISKIIQRIIELTEQHIQRSFS